MTVTVTKPAFNIRDELVSAKGAAKTNLPVFKAFLSANSTAFSTNTWQKVAHDVKAYDSHNAYSTTLNRYTVPVTGIYLVSGISTVITSSSTGTQFRSGVYKNGVWYAYLSNSNGYTGGYENSFASSVLLHLTAGDYIEHYVYVMTSSGNNPYLFANNSESYTAFSAICLRGT